MIYQKTGPAFPAVQAPETGLVEMARFASAQLAARGGGQNLVSECVTERRKSLSVDEHHKMLLKRPAGFHQIEFGQMLAERRAERA